MKALSKQTRLLPLLIFLLCFYAKPMKAQWSPIDSSALGSDTKMFFFGPDTAMVSYSGNKFVRTTDAGNTWVTIGPDSHLALGIYFQSSSNGYEILSDPTLTSATFRRTTDGAVSWSPAIPLPGILPSNLILIDFPSPDTGYIMDQTYLIRTTDGGASWTIAYTNPGFYFEAHSFTSSTTGYLSGYNGLTNAGNILKTTDAGITWMPTTYNDPIAAGKISFINATTGFALAANKIFKTTDAGATWTLTNTDLLTLTETSQLLDISFGDALTGYALTLSTDFSNNLLKTTDGGSSWKGYGTFNEAYSDGTYIYHPEAGAICFTGPLTGYLVASMNRIYKTTTGGFSCPGVSVGYLTNNMVAASDSVSFEAFPTIPNNYVYSWTPAANMDHADIQTPVFSTSVPGAYTHVTVTLTDTIWGCPPVSATGFTYTFPTYAGTVSAGNDTVICGAPYNSYQLTAHTNWNDSACWFTWTGPYTWGEAIDLNQDVSAGQYVVTAHFPDNTSASDTIIISIHSQYSDTVFHCTAPSVIGIPAIADGSFSWNTGDTTHTITTNIPGIYTCTATYADVGCVVNNVFTVIDSCSAITNVWPGDANNDLVANNYDVLNIGLGYNNTGALRPAANYSWTPQPMTDWTQFFSTGLNEKHADCNGNGVINISDDTVILDNYNYTHPPMLRTPSSHVRNSTADLYLVADVDTTGLLGTVNVAIMLGNLSVPVDSIYGISYSIAYDRDLVYQDPTITYNNSFFGTPGTDVFSFEKSFYDSGYKDLAISRNNHTNASGNGQIGNAIIVTTDNLSVVSATLHINLYDIHAVTSSGTVINLTGQGDSVYIYSNYTAGINEQQALNAMISIYPNPANEKINVSSTYKNIESICIYNVVGQPLYFEEKPAMNTSIDLDNFANGIYLLSLKTDKGIVNKRITISR